MSEPDFLGAYFRQYHDLLINDEIKERISEFAALVARTKQGNKKLMFAGNGASASISEHGAVDFTKQVQVRAITFHDPNLITCFANDFGYDHWVAKAIEHYGDAGDVVVLVSVSGRSPSVVHAAHTARRLGMTVVAFTGRDADNPLKALADLNFWVPSHAYNVVENLHSIWITATIDYLLGKSVYETRNLVK